MECRQDLELLRKSTKTYELQFKKDGASVDITGWTVYFTIKEEMEDEDADAKLAKTITSFDNATSGIALIELSIVDTDITAGNYWYSMDFKDDDGNEGTVITGKIKIKEPVLKSRS